MRIVIDLQAAQNDSSFRGVGRYCKSLALEMSNQAARRGHDVLILLNSNFADTVSRIKDDFAGIVASNRIVTFPGLMPVTETVAQNEWRIRAAELLREEFISQLNPDVVHVSSLFEGSVDDAIASVNRGAASVPTAVTLYDLIPWALPELYITSPEYSRYYFSKIDSLRRADLLLSISEHSRVDAIARMSIAPESIVNISASLDGHFEHRKHTPEEVLALTRRYGITRRFLLYIPGGFDPRKNFSNLFDAYSRLPGDIRGSHQLVIGSNIKSHEREALDSQIASFGLEPDEVITTGYVSDVDLISLYSLCELHVFPSLYEGFGLPALEGLACGAPTIASNTSSLPEVVGLKEALFDPASPQDIAERMLCVLRDPQFASMLRTHGLTHARGFSWSRSASIALGAIEERFAARNVTVLR